MLARLCGQSTLVLFAFSAFCQPGFAKCAVRTVTQADGSIATFQIVVPNAKFAEAEALGYQQSACNIADEKIHREKLCAPKAFGNSGVQRQLEVLAGFTFSELCGFARQEQELMADTGMEPVQVLGQLSKERQLPRPVQGPKKTGPLAKVKKAAIGEQ